MTKIGVAQWVVDRPGPRAIARAAALGFEAIHLDAGLPGSENFVGRSVASRRYGLLAADSGVAIVGLACTGVDQLGILGRPEGRTVDRCRDIVHAALDAALELGCPLVYVPSLERGRIREPDDLMRTADLLREACEHAEAGGVLVATENTLGATGNRELFARVSHPRLRVLFDHYNPLISGHDPLELLGAVREHLCDQIQVKDGRDGAVGSTPLGEGDGRFHATCEHLRASGYTGLVISANDYRMDAEARAKRDLLALRRHFAAGSARDGVT